MNFLLALLFTVFVWSYALAIRSYRDRESTGRQETRGGFGRQSSLLKALGVQSNERTANFPLRFGPAVIEVGGKSVRAGRRGAANEPSRCLPDSFQMPMRQTTIVSKGPRTNLVRSEASLAVDSKSQMAAFNQSVWVDSKLLSRSSAVLDVANQTLYMLDQKRSCSISKKMPGIKLQLCIPSTSQLYSSMVLGTGASQAGLAVDVWDVPVPIRQVKVFLVATQRDFTPVSETVIAASEKGRVEAFQETGFVNFTLGIKDKSVFNVPPPCQSAEPSRRGRCFNEDCAPEW